MTKMSEGNKKIKRKLLATNDKALVHTSIVCAFSGNTGNQL